ncbi:MAG: peroxiredoxin family protein [Bryobacteraceae bacterium]
MQRALLLLALCAVTLPGAGELSGRRAPGFSLADTTGRQHDLQDYRGKWVVLEFFQSTCPHCAGFAGVLAQAHARYAGRVQILSIAVYPDKGTDVLRFISGHKIQFPVMFDCGQVTASYYKATPEKPTVEFPHVFLIDPQGTIRNDFGYSLLTRDIFEGKGLFRELDRLLGAPAPPARKK